MTLSVRYLEQDGVIETVHAGGVTRRELEEALEKTGAEAARHGCRRILVDLSDQGPAAGPVDIVDAATLLAALPPGTIERQALLLPPRERGASDVEFFETACRNRSLNVRVFSDRDEALGWLRA